ncbi:MAG TPA: hypothetical protein VLA49_01360 [Anaerolineales bacterium]|nr:hypothetical protein [Anaerolineales bacterium]
MSNLESKLQTSLYRAFCPDSTELGEYFLKTLSRDRTNLIREHLKDCPHCIRELKQLGEFLEAVRGDIETSLTERLRVFIAQLVRPDTLVPAFAALRGEGGEALTYAAAGFNVVLEIQTDVDRPDRKMILGLLAGEAPGNFTARLEQESRPIAEAQVDEFGNFILTQVQPGNYQLILRAPLVEIQIEQISIS